MTMTTIMKSSNDSSNAMKVLSFQYHQLNEVDVVQMKRPEPLTANQIQVKVEFAATDTAIDDVLERTWTGFFVHKLTKTSKSKDGDAFVDGNKCLRLGWHFSGTVTAVGPQDINDKKKKTTESPRYLVGDAVFGHLLHGPGTIDGTFAEYIVVNANECAKRPEQILSKIAAASTTETLTALQALRDYGGLKRQNANGVQHQPSVLVIGGAGGVGSAAVQIARIMGAHVTAVCSARDVERVREGYGAHVVLSRDEYPDPLQDYDSGKHKYDIIFDTPVVLSPNQALDHLHPHGHYITTLPSWGLMWGMMKSAFVNKGVHMVEVKPRHDDFNTIAKWLVERKLEIPIDSTYKVKDMPKAMQRQRQRKAGRVSIQVEYGWD